MSIYNITHRADMDGMASSAMLVRYYKMPTKNIFFLSYDKKNIEYVAAQIAKRRPRNSTIIMTDLGINDSSIESFKQIFGKLKKDNNKIIWIDHHFCSDAVIDAMSKLCDFMIGGDNKKYCATELTYMLLCKKDAFGDNISQITHITDFNLKSKKYHDTLRRIASSIVYINNYIYPSDKKKGDDMLRRFVTYVSKGNIENSFISQLNKRYIGESKKRIVELLDTARVIDASQKIAVGFSKQLHSTAACAHLEEQFNADIMIYVDTIRGSAHLRSKKGVNSLLLAMAFGGGGHEQACGFEFDLDKFDNLSKHGKNAFIEAVDSKAQTIYNK